jgi:hypothetical protein
MAGIQGTNIVAPVVPLDTADVHPTHEALYGRGGYRTVATTAERDAISSARREVGMLVFVTADSQRYRLGSDLTTWTVDAAGASAWADITGKPSTFAPSSHAHGNIGNTGSLASATMTASSVGGPVVFDVLAGNVSRGAFGTAAGEVCQGNDSRLSNARTPTSHAASHAAGGSDPITVGTAGDRIVVTTTGGKLAAVSRLTTLQVQHESGTQLSSIDSLIADAGSFGLDAAVTSHVTKGTTSETVCAGNDSRLSDARAPSSHVHAAGDITSGTIATARLGSGTASASTFLRGDGSWATAGSTNAGDLTSGTLAEARLPNLVILHPFLLAGM